MNWNRYFKTNWSKIVALLLLFAVIAFFGGLLFSWGYRFQKSTWLLRGAYMAKRGRPRKVTHRRRRKKNSNLIFYLF